MVTPPPAHDAAAIAEIAVNFAQRMANACDRTFARKGGVLVNAADWHRLMDLAEQVRASLAQSKGEE